METTVKCGHCDGTGICKKGEDGYSCNSCTNAAGKFFNKNILGSGKTVKCSVCDGVGYVILSKKN